MPVIQTISWSFVYGSRSSISQIIHLIQNRPLKNVLYGLTHLLNLSNQFEIEETNQNDVARSFLPTDTYADLTSKFDLSQFIVFDKDALRLLFQLACISCSETSKTEDNLAETCKIVGKAALMASDHISPDIDLESEKKPKDPIAILLHSYDSRFNSRLDFLTLARVKSIWIDALGAMASRASFVKVLNRFQSNFGVTVEHFLNVATSCLALFSQKPTPVTLNPREYFKGCADIESCYRVVQNLSLRQDELASKLIRNSRHCWATDTTVLKKFPFLRLNDDEFGCFDSGLLNQLLVDGIYWLLSETGDEVGVDFKSSFGEVFALHVENVIEEFAVTSELLYKQFFKSPFAIGTNDEIADGIVCLYDATAVIEYKSGFLTPHQKYSWNSDAVYNAIDGMFCSNRNGKRKGAAQLAYGINRLFREGKFLSNGKEYTFDTNVTEIVPVVIVQEVCASMSLAQKRIRGKFKEFLGDQAATNIRSLVVLSINELELLSELKVNKGKALVEFSKFMDSNESALDGDFVNFVHTNYKDHYSESDSFRKRNGKEHLMNVQEKLGL